MWVSHLVCGVGLGDPHPGELAWPVGGGGGRGLGDGDLEVAGTLLLLWTTGAGEATRSVMAHAHSGYIDQWSYYL